MGRMVGAEETAVPEGVVSDFGNGNQKIGQPYIESFPLQIVGKTELTGEMLKEKPGDENKVNGAVLKKAVLQAALPHVPVDANGAQHMSGQDEDDGQSAEAVNVR